MQALSIELEDETVDALEAERELFGFESRQAYVRWIIDHRGSIETGDGADRGRKRDRLLADHSERIARLEEQVATLSRALEADGETGTVASGREREEGVAKRDRESDTATDDAGTAGDRDADERTSAVATDETGSNRRDRDRTPGEAATTEPEPEPVLEVRGSPRTVRQGPDSRIRSSEPKPEDGDADDASRSATDGEPSTASTRGGDGTERDARVDAAEAEASQSSPLTPERVARIREDPVHEDAGVLGNVEAERLDELSRRAVATTRKRLNRDVETGLQYTSSTRLAGDGVRPGEDVTDLDALSIPGRSEETLEKRRHAVGRALAYLRDEGRARRSDFVDALYEECPAGYDTTDGWWRCIKEGLKQVDAVEGGEGTRVWRYRG